MPLEFGLKDFIDIFLVALMLFYCYKVMKESRSLNVFFGVLIFVVFWLFVSQILEMKLLGSILDKLVSVGTLALIILFQEEIRNFFFTIGTHRQVESLLKLIRRNKKDNKKTNKDDIMPIVMACMSMSKQKVIIIVLIVLYSLARTAGESDRTMEQIREQSLLGREESSGGNS